MQFLFSIAHTDFYRLRFQFFGFRKKGIIAVKEVDHLLRNRKRGVDLAAWVAQRNHCYISARTDRLEEKVEVASDFFSPCPEVPGILYILGHQEIILADREIRCGICRIRFCHLECRAKMAQTQLRMLRD